METKQIRQIPKITTEQSKIRRRKKAQKSDYRDDGKEKVLLSAACAVALPVRRPF